MRMLIRASKKYKAVANSDKIGLYLLKGANYFFPYDITLANYKDFEQLLKIGKNVKILKPDLQKVNSKHLALYLNSQYD